MWSMPMNEETDETIENLKYDISNKNLKSAIKKLKKEI
jgi:hypothetical protein